MGRFFGKTNPIELPDWVRLKEVRLKDTIDWYSDDWREREENYRIYAGKIFTKDQKDSAKQHLKHLLEFSTLPAIINSGTGREPVNRYRPALKGRERGEKVPEIAALLEEMFGIADVQNDPQLAQAMTEAIRWIEQQCDADGEISDSFFDSWICGVGYTNTWFDPMDGVDGKLKTSEHPPWDIGFDIDSKKRNHSDAQYVFAWKYVSLEEAAAMFPEKSDDIATAAANNRFHMPTAKSRPHDQFPSFQRSEQGFYNPHTYQVELTDYQFKQREDRYLFVDPTTGLDRNLDLREFRAELRRFRAEGAPEPEYDRIPQWAYKRGWFAGEVQLTDQPEDLPIQDFTYGAITCYPYKSPRGTKWFGPGHLGKDPERWRSKFLSVVLDIFGSSPKAPIILSSNAVEPNDVETFRREVTRPDGMPVVKDLEDVKFGPSPNYAQGMMPLVQFATGGVWEAVGMSQVSAGLLDDPRRAAFQTVNAIMQAGQSVFAMPFDSLRFHRLNLARKYLLYMPQVIEPKNLLRALGHEYVQPLLGLLKQEQIADRTLYVWDEEKFANVMQFDLVADETPVTPNSQIAMLQVLTQTDMYSLLQNAGYAPPLEVLLDIFEGMGGLTATQKEAWIQNPAGIAPEQQTAIIEAFISQLSPELQQAIEAEAQAGQGAAAGEEVVQ